MHAPEQLPYVQKLMQHRVYDTERWRGSTNKGQETGCANIIVFDCGRQRASYLETLFEVLETIL